MQKQINRRNALAVGTAAAGALIRNHERHDATPLTGNSASLEYRHRQDTNPACRGKIFFARGPLPPTIGSHGATARPAGGGEMMNDEFRMTNQARMTNSECAVAAAVRHSGFVIGSAFVIRNSALRAAAGDPPAPRRVSPFSRAATTADARARRRRGRGGGS